MSQYNPQLTPEENERRENPEAGILGVFGAVALYLLIAYAFTHKPWQLVVGLALVPTVAVIIYIESNLPEPPAYLHMDIVHYILTSTRHIAIRVGGYSYRVADIVKKVAKELRCEPWRVEYLSGSMMEEYDFDPDSDFVKYVEGYDYKFFSMEGESHPMVFYYVNKIDTGFYNEDGSFVPFYNKDRGLQALTDVAMIHGYGDVRPATAALYTDSWKGRGDTPQIGPTIHSDKKTIGSSQRGLFEDAGIKFLNLNDVKRD